MRLPVFCSAAALAVSLAAWAAPGGAQAAHSDHSAVGAAKRPAFPRFDSAAAVQAACDAGLAAAARKVRWLERQAPTPSWVAAYDDLNAVIEDASGPVTFIVNVHPDPAVRDAAQACEQRWQTFQSTLGQNAKLYRAARAVRPRDAIDRALLKEAIDNFEESGVGLPPPQRQRAKVINDRIGELGQQFSRVLRDDTTKLPFTEAELAGVPEAVWKSKPRDEQGRFLLGLDAPTAVPVLERADDPRTRERMYRARNTLGGDGNIALLGEMVRLRGEYAALFGAASFADFTLRRRMALNTANTSRFLDEVRAAVSTRERSELDELRQAKAQHLGESQAQAQAPQATRLERWDVPYYTERLRRERYTVDQNAFRPYFPPQASLDFVMKLAEQLLGVRYVRVPATLWHPDVQAYAATDVKTGRPLATLYIDLYPRDGKYNHAAVWSIQNGATRTGRLPLAALVVNLDRQGLTLDELETLLHEMGHALHNNLSATRHSLQAGTSVLRDFVEAPSQMLEDWVYDKGVLALFAAVCPACKPVPNELLAKAVAARNDGKGVRTARQHLYASYDLALHSAVPSDPQRLWAAMEGATPLGHVAGTQLPASFEHLASGYAAGYYGYLWSLVVATDLRTAFSGHRLDPVVGQRYRSTVLGQGSQRPPADLVRDFLGRDSNARAFFDDLKR